MTDRSRGASWMALCLAGLCASPALAAMKVDLGLKAGFDIASHWSAAEGSPGATVETDSRYGFLLGATARFPLSEVFTLQPEILFVRKGSTQNVRIDGFPFGAIVTEYDLKYLEIPVVLRAHFLRGKKVRPTIGIGTYFAYLLKGAYTFSNGFLGTFSDDLDDMKKTDFGVVSDYGLEVESGKVRIGIFYRFTMGFVDLGLPTGQGGATVDLRNNCHAVTLEVHL